MSSGAMNPEWRYAPVREIAQRIVGGGTPARDVPSMWNGGVPWVTPGELTRLRTKYLMGTAETISRSGLASSGATLLPPDSLIVTTRATVGLVALTSVPTTTNQGFKSVVFYRNVDPSFYYHVFTTLKREMERRASGTTFLEISAREFSKIAVPVPPRGEQRRIAEILDTLQEQILKTEQIIAKLQLVKHGLRYDLLTCGINGPGDIRNPITDPDHFHDSPLGRIPIDWKVRTLESVTAAPICYGIVQSGAYHEDGPFVLTIGDLYGDFRSGLHRTSPTVDQQYARSRVRELDVLLSIKGTIGRAAIVPEWFKGNISRDLARLRFSEAVVPGFARQYLSSAIGQRRLELAVVGTTRAEVSIYVLKRFGIPVPPVEEQIKIEQRLAAADDAIAAEEQRLEKLRMVKNGLMADLLTGRVHAPVEDVA